MKQHPTPSNTRPTPPEPGQPVMLKRTPRGKWTREVVAGRIFTVVAVRGDLTWYEPSDGKSPGWRFPKGVR